MIEQNICKRVLTIGCQWKKPKGGIAVVLNSYSKIFQEFNITVNSSEKNAVANVVQLLYSLIATTFKLLQCRKTKIVHIHTASNNSFRRSAMFISLAKTFNKKVVIHIHGGGFKEYYEKNKEYVHGQLAKCDTIIALTDYWHKFFSSLGFKNVVVIPNIVDTPVIEKKKEDDGLTHILYLGLITRQKGIYDLLEAISEHKDELNDKVMLHIGGNGETEKLQEIIAKKELSSIVKFEGWVSGKKKIELLNNAYIFILPSYTEGLPISILEAMAYSIPVISTPVGGIPEVINNGENGFLVQPGDKETLYNAIMNLAKDKSLREKMGSASYQKVQQHFPDNVSEKLEHIYKELLNR